jgi:L-aminopeptidase/D-esterase-like protein
MASARLPGGRRVGAIAVVNAWGDVRDPLTGAILAGCRAAEGEAGPFADTVALLQRGEVGRGFAPGTGGGEASAIESTTLVAIVTDAPLGKLALARVAKMGHDGLARAVRPVHTPWDGDVVYAISTAEAEDAGADPTAVGALGAEATAAAIARAVLLADSVPGVPAVEVTHER